MITAVGSGSYELLEQGATCCSFVETREKITAVGAGAVAMAATSMWKQVSHVFFFAGARGKITGVDAGAVAATNLWRQVSPPQTLGVQYHRPTLESQVGMVKVMLYRKIRFKASFVYEN